MCILRQKKKKLKEVIQMNENKTNINWEITTYEKLPIKAYK